MSVPLIKEHSHGGVTPQYTIEGNKTPCVQGFPYVLGRIDQLLGFGHVP